MERGEAVKTIVQWIVEAEKTIIFTGAGVSTESGVPDFRSPGGLWDRYDPEEFYYDRFLASQESRRKYWKVHSELYNLLTQVRPNSCHYACVELDKMGKLERVITQNIDNLHQEAGLPSEKVIELHGNALLVACLDCGNQYSRKEVQGWIEAGEQVPRCKKCQGILKPLTVSFGQPMPAEQMQEAESSSRCCDLFIVIGSSLVVYPAAMIPALAKRSGARLVIINMTSTPYDQEADLLIQGKAGEVMTEIVQKVREKLRC